MTVHNILNRLIKKGLIEKDPDTKWLRTTKKWYNAIVLVRIQISNSKDSLPIDKKLYSTQERNFTPSSKETLHNKNSYNNKDNNKKVHKIEDRKPKPEGVQQLKDSISRKK